MFADDKHEFGARGTIHKPDNALSLCLMMLHRGNSNGILMYDGCLVYSK